MISNRRALLSASLCSSKVSDYRRCDKLDASTHSISPYHLLQINLTYMKPFFFFFTSLPFVRCCRPRPPVRLGFWQRKRSDLVQRARIRPAIDWVEFGSHNPTRLILDPFSGCTGHRVHIPVSGRIYSSISGSAPFCFGGLPCFPSSPPHKKSDEQGGGN